MHSGFPPSPKYPLGLDDNFSLYEVHNTAETITSDENPPWSEQIDIVPVGADEPELWSDNGYANIEGELFYYDAVSKDINGKVCSLKRCLRNLGGTPTQYNPAGSEVRGYVVAEHHNQLIQCILQIENFIGYNYTPNQETLDWRIRNLQALPVIFDDACPDVDFSFITLSIDPSAGTSISYVVNITGTYSSFSLTFGDGSSTTTTSGTHTYAPSATIDPIVTVSSPTCTMVQTPQLRASSVSPEIVPPVTNFQIVVPQIPELKDPVIPACVIPALQFNFPPIQFPCLDISPIGPISITIPNEPISIVIVGPGFPNIPSIIVVDPPIPSIITFEPALDIPDTITFDTGGLSIPSLISFTEITWVSLISFYKFNWVSLISFYQFNWVSMISFYPFNWVSMISFYPFNWVSIISFYELNYVSIISFYTPPVVSFQGWGNVPVISFAGWGNVPTISCVVTVTCANSMGFRASPYTPNYQDEDDTIELDMGNLGIPSEININPPVIPNININPFTIPDIQVVHDIPSVLKMEMTHIPDIRLLPPIEPMIMTLDTPETIKLDTSDAFVRLEVPESTKIILDTSGLPDKIQLVGPSSIQLVGPSAIQLVLPENLKVPLVYEGSPIPLKITMDNLFNISGQNNNGIIGPVMIVPVN